MFRSRAWSAAKAVTVGLAVASFATAAPSVAQDAQAPAHPAVWRTHASEAMTYARRHNIRAGIAAINLNTGSLFTAGDQGEYGSASVVKVLITTRLLLQGASSPLKARMYHMIVGSDDADADALWPRAGGWGLVPWLERHYSINIGDPNLLAGRWGNTQLLPAGMARFYRKAFHDPKVWPFLHNAMAHTRKYADDGTNQYFGIPSAGAGHVIKQGWGGWSAGDYRSATINTTGIVRSANGTLFALVIFTQGHNNDRQTDGRAFNAPQAAVATQLARDLLPGGRLHFT